MFILLTFYQNLIKLSILVVFNAYLFSSSLLQKDLNIENFPDRPLQLVAPDVAHKKLVLVEENVKVFTYK